MVNGFIFEYKKDLFLRFILGFILRYIFIED